MNNLEVIRYIDKKTKTIQPFIKEKESNSDNWIALQYFRTIIDEFKCSKEEKKEMKKAISTSYYIELLKKGYEYKEIITLLQQEFTNQYDLPRSQSSFNCISSLDYISLELEALKDAYQEYSKDKDCYGLSGFINDTPYFMMKEATKTPNYILERSLIRKKASLES